VKAWGFWTLDPAADGERLQAVAAAAAAQTETTLELEHWGTLRVRKVPGGRYGVWIKSAVCAVGLACGAPAEDAAPVAVETTQAPQVVPFRYPITLEPAIADDGLQAVELLQRVTLGQYDPELTIGECTGAERFCVRAVDVVPDCAGEHAPWGCMDPDTRTVYVIAKFHPELRVSIVVHELMHTLGMLHSDGSVMTPDRSWVDFYWSCVSAETAAILKERAGFAETQAACIREPEPVR
jgi:hypothetical protein